METISIDNNTKCCLYFGWRFAISRWYSCQILIHPWHNVWIISTNNSYLNSRFFKLKRLRFATWIMRGKAPLIFWLEMKDTILQNICRHPFNETLDDSMGSTQRSFVESTAMLQYCLLLWALNISDIFQGISTMWWDDCVMSIVNCTEIFNRILTDWGLCGIFNGLHKKFIMNLEYALILLVLCS